MERIVGAHIDEKTGHEIQRTSYDREIDLDDTIKRLKLADDDPHRHAVREMLARDPGISDVILKEAAKGHVKRRATEAKAEQDARAAKEAEEQKIIDGHKKLIAEHHRKHGTNTE